MFISDRLPSFFGLLTPVLTYVTNYLEWIRNAKIIQNPIINSPTTRLMTIYEDSDFLSNLFILSSTPSCFLTNPGTSK